MELLRLLVEQGPNSDLRRLLFSNFSLLLSFLDVGAPAPTAASSSEQAVVVGGGGDGRSGGGGRRLFFASPVARLMGEVVNQDYVLVTSVSEEHLTQLAMAATRSRYGM